MGPDFQGQSLLVICLLVLFKSLRSPRGAFPFGANGGPRRGLGRCALKAIVQGTRDLLTKFLVLTAVLVVLG